MGWFNLPHSPTVPKNEWSNYRRLDGGKDNENRRDLRRRNKIAFQSAYHPRVCVQLCLHDLYIRTSPRYSEDVHACQKWSF